MYPNTNTDTFNFMKTYPDADLDAVKVQISGHFLNMDTFCPTVTNRWFLFLRIVAS